MVRSWFFRSSLQNHVDFHLAAVCENVALYLISPCCRFSVFFDENSCAFYLFNCAMRWLAVRLDLLACKLTQAHVTATVMFLHESQGVLHLWGIWLIDSPQKQINKYCEFWNIELHQEYFTKSVSFWRYASSFYIVKKFHNINILRDKFQVN